MAYITLEEAKAQVVCEHNEDDAYISSLIEVAEANLQHLINRPLDEVLEAGQLPAPLKHTIKMLIAKLYREREGDVQTRSVEVGYTLANLYMPYRRES